MSPARPSASMVGGSSARDHNAARVQHTYGGGPLEVSRDRALGDNLRSSERKIAFLRR
jgi:hypothetical protein